MLQDDLMADVMQHMTLEDSSAAAGETPECARFRQLPQALQRRLLRDFPRALATAMHEYSSGDDCESILMRLFESTAEMLRVPNADGDGPIASALVRGQGERAEKLTELAETRNPAALDDRSQFKESLLMLSTSSSSADGVMRRLMLRDPTQLHRLYDMDGRNLLHHCALEESEQPLASALKLTAQLLQEGRLSPGQVSAAIHMNDRGGDTPLHLMAAANRRDMLQLLQEFGAQANIDIHADERQHRGSRWTPLMTAVGSGNLEAAQFLLLELGADPSVEDTEGRTAETLAYSSDRMMRLFSAGATPEGAEAAAAADASGAWLTDQQPHGVGTMDSGMCTGGLLTSEPPVHRAVGADDADDDNEKGLSRLSRDEIARLSRGLAEADKVDAFVGAFARSHAQKVALARMSQEPVVSLVTQLAHEPCVRQRVLDALREVGEPGLLPMDG